MSVSSRVGAALCAVALSACAHQGAQLASSPSYPGGRAAQAGGYIPSSEPARFEQAAVATRDGRSYLGGQAGEPSSWLASQSPEVASVGGGETCLAAGRAAQPFSGPSLRAVETQRHGESSVACRSDLSRF